MKILKSLFLLLVTTNAFAGAGYILEGATIKEVSSTTGNANAFWIKHTGGSGECATSTIKFYESDAGHADIFKRTYTAAVTAFVSNVKVNVYRYAGEECNGVSIELTK